MTSYKEVLNLFLNEVVISISHYYFMAYFFVWAYKARLEFTLRSYHTLVNSEQFDNAYIPKFNVLEKWHEDLQA